MHSMLRWSLMWSHHKITWPWTLDGTTGQGGMQGGMVVVVVFKPRSLSSVRSGFYHDDLISRSVNQPIRYVGLFRPESAAMMMMGWSNSCDAIKDCKQVRALWDPMGC
ncbi:hypothetical protein INR49_006516 [Caranx melampygus]|nr:hypothetical protein INR49_006516 [Caranx melampygus]